MIRNLNKTAHIEDYTVTPRAIGTGSVVVETMNSPVLFLVILISIGPTVNSNKKWILVSFFVTKVP